MKKTICLILALLILAALAACGAAAPAATAEPTVPPEPVTLLVAGAWEDCKAIEAVGREFTAVYPNCTIEYEYLQDYDTALPKRMTGENAVDMFFYYNIQADSELLEYVVDLYDVEGLDLSGTFPGLIENFEFFSEDDSAPKKLYSVPLGAELRGMYVNTTLLDSLGIALPTDQASLLAACETLKTNGYTPFHGNPGTFSQLLLYPWICNIIANADDPQAAYDKVYNREAGLGEMFAEPFEFMYLLVEKGYYDYKAVQTDLGLFMDATDDGYARDFFNLRQNGDVWEKADDVGQVAFMPSAFSMHAVLDKYKADYHSEIEFTFVTAPVGVDGGYAYMSPARGISVNGNDHEEWSIKFLNFLFQKENNELFAEEFNIIPNTAGAFDYISTLFDIPDSHISHLGQVTFDYGFYGIVTDTLVDISKGNNPKYMQDNGDGTVSLYPLSYYVEAFEEAIAGNGN